MIMDVQCRCWGNMLDHCLNSSGADVPQNLGLMNPTRSCRSAQACLTSEFWWSSVVTVSM